MLSELVAPPCPFSIDITKFIANKLGSNNNNKNYFDRRKRPSAKVPNQVSVQNISERRVIGEQGGYSAKVVKNHVDSARFDDFVNKFNIDMTQRFCQHVSSKFGLNSLKKILRNISGT